MPPTPLRHTSRLSRLARIRRRNGDQGQSLVEFSLILAPLLFILLGIIQFGFIFQGYIALSNAVRESARVATVYVYDVSLSRSANDTARNALARTTLLASLNGLAKTSPNFSTSGSWTTTTSGTTVTATNGDMTITYVLPATVTDNDPRQGYRLTLRADYHQDLIVPLISALLPKDANGRLVLTGEVTMVLN